VSKPVSGYDAAGAANRTRIASSIVAICLARSSGSSLSRLRRSTRASRGANRTRRSSSSDASRSYPQLKLVECRDELGVGEQHVQARQQARVYLLEALQKYRPVLVHGRRSIAEADPVVRARFLAELARERHLIGVDGLPHHGRHE